MVTPVETSVGAGHVVGSLVQIWAWLDPITKLVPVIVGVLALCVALRNLYLSRRVNFGPPRLKYKVKAMIAPRGFFGRTDGQIEITVTNQSHAPVTLTDIFVTTYAGEKRKFGDDIDLRLDRERPEKTIAELSLGDPDVRRIEFASSSGKRFRLDSATHRQLKVDAAAMEKEVEELREREENAATSRHITDAMAKRISLNGRL